MDAPAFVYYLLELNYILYRRWVVKNVPFVAVHYRQSRLNVHTSMDGSAVQCSAVGNDFYILYVRHVLF
jgi:hypothetical protein